MEIRSEEERDRQKDRDSQSVVSQSALRNKSAETLNSVEVLLQLYCFPYFCLSPSALLCSTNLVTCVGKVKSTGVDIAAVGVTLDNWLLSSFTAHVLHLRTFVSRSHLFRMFFPS